MPRMLASHEKSLGTRPCFFSVEFQTKKFNFFVRHYIVAIDFGLQIKFYRRIEISGVPVVLSGSWIEQTRVFPARKYTTDSRISGTEIQESTGETVRSAGRLSPRSGLRSDVDDFPERTVKLQCSILTFQIFRQYPSTR